jgi:Anti-sigma-K factor rskA
MSDERDLTGVEDLLRSVPVPSEVPARYESMARAAALEGTQIPEVVQRERVSSRRPRWFALGAALAGVAAVVLVVGLLVTRSSNDVQQTITLQGTPAFASSSGTVDLGAPDGAMRPAVMTIKGLPPAPAGEYYEMWFSSGSDSVGMMAFNTESDGTVTVHSAIPSGMGWKRCWVSLEREQGGKTVVQPVMAST